MFDLVIKPFKSNGVLYERGTVITDPSLIRRYILKLREGKILQVDLDNEQLKYKFDILVQKYHLDKDKILAAAGLITPPSTPVDEVQPEEPKVDEVQPEEPKVDEVDYENMTPAQKSAYTKKMKKLAKLAEQENISE